MINTLDKYYSNSPQANLFRAIINNDEEKCIDILENENIDIHKKDSEIDVCQLNYNYIRNAAPIIIASECGNLKIVEALILHGANINDTDINNRNSLMKASIYGNIDIIKLLLSKNINIYEKNNNNNATAILYASLHSQKEVVQLLLSNGASFYDKTINDVSCLTATHNYEIKSIFKKWPITMIIIILEQLFLDGDFLESNILDLQEYFGAVF